MNARDRVLLHAPPAMQSLLVTIGSGMRAGRRYGRVFQDALSKLEQNESLDREAWSAARSRLLADALSNAKTQVPFYHVNPGAAEDLSSWPIVDKKAIQERPDGFISDRYRRGDLLRTETSGTSGSPLSVFTTADAYQWEMAFRWRHRAWAGVAYESRGAYFSGHLVAPAARREPPFWVYDGAEKRLLFSSYHMSDRTLPAYVARLAAFNPEFVHGYPSSLYLVAQAVLRSAHRPRPRAVFAASETLLAHQRLLIEEAFGCKVYVWYGQTEMTCNVVECAEGGLHVREDYGLLEVLSDGTALGTGFRNPAMPFIRYRLGDEIVLKGGDCPCGRGFQLVEAIGGRNEDYVVTPDGTRVGRLDHLFKGAVGVTEAQIVQEQPDLVTLVIVRGDEFSPATEHLILREAKERLGPTVRVEMRFVPSIPRGPNGKFRFVVGRAASRFAGAGAPTEHPPADTFSASTHREAEKR